MLISYYTLKYVKNREAVCSFLVVAGEWQKRGELFGKEAVSVRKSLTTN